MKSLIKICAIALLIAITTAVSAQPDFLDTQLPKPWSAELPYAHQRTFVPTTTHPTYKL